MASYAQASSGFQVSIGGTDIIFDTNGPLSGITHAAGTATFTVQFTGVYLVSAMTNISTGNGMTLQPAVNGVVAGQWVSALIQTGQVHIDNLLSLSAGDVVALRNTSGVPFNIAEAVIIIVQIA